MELNSISGVNAHEFMQQFGYIREAGTDGEKRAANTIVESLRALGFEPEVEEFEISRSVVHGASFCVTSPFEMELPVAGVRGTCATPPEGIRAEFFFVGEGDEISLSQAAGKIILISHRPYGEEYYKLMKSGAVGLVYVCGTPVDKGEDRMPMGNKIYYKGVPTLPTVAMHYNDARTLVESGAVEVELMLDLREEASVSQNIIVRVEGTRIPKRRIALTAHYDSVPEGPGAYDNLAGAGILYENCRYFAQHPPKHTMEFIFTGAEEIGCCGSINYLLRRTNMWFKYLININIDLAGQTVGGTVIGVTADESLMEVIREQLYKCKIGAGLRQDIWSGDANTFARCGIPAITIDRDGYGMHTRYDTLELISPWALERDAKLCACLANYFDECEIQTFKREIPAAMMEKLKGRFRRSFKQI